MQCKCGGMTSDHNVVRDYTVVGKYMECNWCGRTTWLWRRGDLIEEQMKQGINRKDGLSKQSQEGLWISWKKILELMNDPRFHLMMRNAVFLQQKIAYSALNPKVNEPTPKPVEDEEMNRLQLECYTAHGKSLATVYWFLYGRVDVYDFNRIKSIKDIVPYNILGQPKD